MGSLPALVWAESEGACLGDIESSGESLVHYKNARNDSAGDKLAIVVAGSKSACTMLDKPAGIQEIRLLLATLHEQRILKNLCRTTGLLIAFK
jgi:predicted amino acid racemase